MTQRGNRRDEIGVASPYFPGRPRIQKAYAQATSCEPCGIHERRVMKRTLPQEFRAMKRGDFAPLQAWQLDGDEVTAAQPVT